MVFSSTIFLWVFLPICLIGYYLLDRKFKNTFLLIMSLIFYAWGEPKFVILLMISIIINYLIALFIDKKRDSEICLRLSMIVMIVWNFGLFFIFKYLVFTMKNINLLFRADLSIPDIALPIGISFFTFQAVSYVMDVYRKKCDVQKNLFDLALYIAFFPQLVAGPIVRYNSIVTQLKSRKETLDLFYSGIKRFIVGFAKKLILANFFGIITDRIFNVSGDELTFAMAWLGGIGYSLQLYYDFSGYSDMAIGLGRMFGFEFEENFDYPYIARSIREYWRRWHISLGAWFREYVFYPITTSRWLAKFNKKIKNKFGFKVSRKVGVMLPLFITWMATGIWHGATWNYVIWGFYFSFLIIMENLGFDKKLESVPKVFQHIYVTVIMLIARIIVRTSSVSQFVQYMKAMLGFGNGFTDAHTNFLWSTYIVIIIIGIIFCIPIAKWIKKKVSLNKITSCIWLILEPICYGLLFVVSISFMVNTTYNPFIYFNF